MRRSNLTRVILKRGGKSPNHIFQDADVENVPELHSRNILFDTSQACVAASRVFVYKDIAPRFIEQLKAESSTCMQPAHLWTPPSPLDLWWMLIN